MSDDIAGLNEKMKRLSWPTDAVNVIESLEFRLSSLRSQLEAAEQRAAEAEKAIEHWKGVAGRAGERLLGLENDRDTLHAALAEAVGALEWYARDDDAQGQKFYIVDKDGQRIAKFSDFTSRAQQALRSSPPQVETMRAVVEAAGPIKLLRDMQKQFGPSPDGAVERDLAAAIDRLCAAVTAHTKAQETSDDGT